ncbi:uncharacterized protein B0T15DRAFT_156731 [Chaetomium strumarium]|uniref:Uncharacterized protein n=1 Tax=Chaetomium strumarium TaxID=1170767 RepID=A0AAJ0GVF5_9PEZI|nr:hypothetical protein B0T15DRAFT_156731 [Chaetomium strumarium]
MRFSTLQAAFGSASILLSAQPVSANLGHRHAHAHYSKRHGHAHQAEEAASAPIVARKAKCTLPDHPDLVYVPGKVNNGFAMSPDQPCEDGTWCPIACVPGKVMAQWKPHTRYIPGDSMYGGLYCNGGTPEKPFDSKPYCVDGTGAVKAVNKAGSVVSFCQTVLPGNEAMIIPTDVTDSVTLAVPGADYWAGTSAHYYINAPGIDSSKGCVWGTIDQPIGNWSPFVAGANTMASGETFVKIAWNPEYLKTPLKNTLPTYGLKIECPDGGCNGVPCSIDPSKDGLNGVSSPVATDGVEGSGFCVVTVPKGRTANIVVFNTDGSSGAPASSSKSKEPPKTTSVAKPTTTSTPSTSSAPPSTSSSTSTSSSSSSSSSSTTPSSSSAKSTTKSASRSSTTSDIFVGGIFQEQSASGETSIYSAPRSTAQPVASTTADAAGPSSATPSKNEGIAAEGDSAMAGLVVALVAAAALF